MDTFLSLSESLPDCPAVLMETMSERENKTSQLSLRAQTPRGWKINWNEVGSHLKSRISPSLGPLCGDSSAPQEVQEDFGFGDPKPLQALPDLFCAAVITNQQLIAGWLLE